MYEAKIEYEKAKKYYEDVRKKEQLVVSNYMFSNLGKNQNSFTITLDEGAYFYANKTDFSVSRVRRKKVTWDIEKLKQKLPKDVLKRALKRTIIIDDFSGLVKYLKSFGVDPLRFKAFLRVEEQVDEESLDQMYELGNVDHDMLNGCYAVELGEPLIRMTKKKHD